MKTLIKLNFIIIVALFIAGNVNGQTAKQIKKAKAEAALKNEITSGHYVFKAEYAYPLHGGQKYLTPDYYDFRVVPDSLIAFLPFFGTVYLDVPLNPQENGIMFTSTKFDYKVEPQKKDGWSIVITPHDVKRTDQMRLDIGSDGAASLQVSSNSRDEIRFDGYIVAKND